MRALSDRLFQITNQLYEFPVKYDNGIYLHTVLRVFVREIFLSSCNTTLYILAAVVR